MHWTWAVSGGLIVLGWIITARVLITQSRIIGNLRERVAWLESKVNGLKGGQHG